jgi:hypothetical protein
MLEEQNLLSPAVITDIEPLLIFSARYAHARPTGAALQVVSCAIRHFGEISQLTRNTLLSEAHSASCCLDDWKRLASHAQTTPSHTPSAVIEANIIKTVETLSVFAARYAHHQQSDTAPIVVVDTALKYWAHLREQTRVQLASESSNEASTHKAEWLRLISHFNGSWD